MEKVWKMSVTHRNSRMWRPALRQRPSCFFGLSDWGERRCLFLGVTDGATYVS